MSNFINKSVLLMVGFVLTISLSANAQLSKEEQGCVNEVNKGFAKVAATQSKEVQGCLKNFAKGKLGLPAATCRNADPKTKVTKSIVKLGSGYGKKCVDAGVDAAVAALFGADMLTTAGAEGVNKEDRILSAVLGLDLDAVVVDATVDKDASGCQLAMVKELYKCQSTKLKTFLGCKKGGLKDGTIVDAASLQTECLDGGIADPKGKIAKQCNDDGAVSGKVDKIRATAAKKCADKGILLADAFAGSDCAAAGTEDDIRACLEVAVECDVCSSINAVDGTSVDCDLFDNGAADGSCGACRNANDQAIVASLDTPTAICIAGCGGDTVCIEACFAPATFSDPTCAGCIGETVDCTIVNCIADCGDPLSIECVTCLDANGCLDCL